MDAGRRGWPLRVGLALQAPPVAARAPVSRLAHVLNANLALVLVLVVLGSAVGGGRVEGVVAAVWRRWPTTSTSPHPMGPSPSPAAVRHGE